MNAENKFRVYAQRGEDGVYTLNFSPEGRYKVSDGRKTYESAGEPLKILAPFPQERVVFSVRKEGGGEIYVSEKLIPMRGVPNFRDMGGIADKCGKRIKWGKIFRSGMLSRSTDTDLIYFKTLGIKTVIDFRSDSEAEREPDKFPGNYDLNYIRVPVGNPADLGKLAELFGRTRDAEEAFKFLVFKGAEILAGSLADFKPVFEAMAGGEPFLFHCSAGKDRTGFAAALALSALGIDQADIIDDYLLSNEYTPPYFTKYVSVITDMGIPEDIALAAAGVRKEFLETVFEIIDKKYGSCENMFSEVFGIGAAEKNELIKKYMI